MFKMNRQQEEELFQLRKELHQTRAELEYHRRETNKKIAMEGFFSGFVMLFVAVVLFLHYSFREEVIGLYNSGQLGIGCLEAAYELKEQTDRN